MRCTKIKNLLPLFLDSQLNQRLSLKIKAHLDTCMDCSKEYELLRKTWGLLEEYRPVSPSPNFKALFWQRLVQEEAWERRPVFVFPKLIPHLVPVLAIVVVILVVGLSLLNFLSDMGIQHLALLVDEDIRMFEELDLARDLEIIENFNTLEDFELIDSIEL